jgi:hypothetical protein
MGVDMYAATSYGASTQERKAVMLTRSQKKNFVFPPEAIEIMAWLKTVCLVKRDADVIRLALGTLSDIMIAIGRGDRVVIKSADGRSERPYHPFLDLEDEPAAPPTEALARYKRGDTSTTRELETA